MANDDPFAMDMSVFQAPDYQPPIDLGYSGYDPNFNWSFPQMPSMPPGPIDPFNFQLPNMQGPPSPISQTPNTGLLAVLQNAMRGLLGGSSQPNSGTPPNGGQAGARQEPGILSQIAGALIPAAGVTSGIGGIIQNLTQGRPTSQQQLRSTVQESPQQAQLTGQTLAALQNLQGLAQNSQLQMAINNLLQGKLPITPDLVDQVTKAFGGSMSGLMKSTAENARMRGFHGSEGDVALGAGSPVFAQGIDDLENEVNSALVNLALGIPGTAANMQTQLVNQAATPISLSENLLGQLGQFAGMQGGRDMTTLGPKPILLSALGPISQLAGGLGQMGAARQMFQPPQQSNLSGV